MKRPLPPLRRLLAACALAFGFWHPAASAQTPNPMPEWQYSGGVILEPYFVKEIPKWQVEAGAGTGMLPRYEGDNKYVFQSGPMIEVHYRDLYFLSLGEGLGANLLHGKGYRAGVALTYDLGRPEDAAAALHGMGDIDPAGEIKLFAEWVPVFPLVLRVDARRGIGGHQGAIADLSLYTPVAGSKHFFVLVGPSVTLVNHPFMDKYFGVSPGQSARTGYSEYNPRGGLKDARLGITATWIIDKNSKWMVHGLVAGERLLGDTLDSPILRTNAQYVGQLYLGYNF